MKNTIFTIHAALPSPVADEFSFSLSLSCDSNDWTSVSSACSLLSSRFGCYGHSMVSVLFIA
ncbi:MAG: hypothetical protein ACTSWN_11430 [Promethearchaeota archaeon]